MEPEPSQRVGSDVDAVPASPVTVVTRRAGEVQPDLGRVERHPVDAAIA
jgi:hypothetical protein